MQILDCTLRDGGYYTDWDFDEALVDTYFSSFNELPVDYLEIGYRSIPLKGYFGQYFYCSEDTLQWVKERTNKKLAIILNEKDIRAEHTEELLSPCKGIITMIRVAVDPANFDRAIELAKSIKRMGFEVAFNVMYMSNWKEREGFLDSISSVNGLVDYFYCVDSFGGVYPNEVKETISEVKSKLSCKVGFHGHNNLELGLINTLTALEYGADIVDATVTGMGRGAGNLKTELLLTALSKQKGLKLDYNQLSTVVNAFTELQQHHGWGTSLPYMVSGANSLPQKEVMEWVTKRFYSFNSIIRALDNRREGKQDNVSVPQFQPSTDQSTTRVLLIGGGPSAASHKVAVRSMIEKVKNLAIVHASSKNAAHYIDLDVPQYFCLVGNEGHRLEQSFEDFGHFRGICVLPPYPRQMGTYIPTRVQDKTFELKQVTFTQLVKDSHTALALQTILDIQAQEVLVIGYDGYKEGNVGQLEISLMQENNQLFQDFQDYGQLDIASLVPTQYGSLSVNSLYSLLAQYE